ncbi:unnamed protein product, partial [Didymodactylos carnosus]
NIYRVSMWYSLALVLLFIGIGQAFNPLNCPTNVTCVEHQTCCLTNQGLWACCPLEDAICCNDGQTCCQKGEKCSSGGNCTKKIVQEENNQITIVETTGFNLIPHSLTPKSVQCPDGQSFCPDGQTCCQLSSGQYGCCPLHDHEHCCPHGYTCDTEHSRCLKKSLTSWFLKSAKFNFIKRHSSLNDNSVTCPDGQSSCPDGQTCCQLSTGQYGCCPLPDAVCCNDHLHCCPHGYTCDTEHSTCKRAEDEFDILPIFKKLPSFKLPKSCPHHYKCDLKVFKCDHDKYEFLSMPLLKKHSAMKTKSIPSTATNNKLATPQKPETLHTVQCPDEKSFCPDDTTCCILKEGGYGCCPFGSATCCADKIHCCSHDYSCDKSGSRCIRHVDSSLSVNNRTLDMVIAAMKKFKMPLMKKGTYTHRISTLDVVQNKHDHSPPSCKQYCRSPATGKLTCCTNRIPLTEGLTINDNQTCPDGVTKCSSKSTCCPNTDENQNVLSYGCCPYQKGVCCGTRGNVCCPFNYICNPTDQSCQLNDIKPTYNFLHTGNPQERNLRLSSPPINACPNLLVSCPTNYTCCQTPTYQYQCCAFTNGTCCSDGLHCCPNGTLCDLNAGGCYQDHNRNK